jgi:hypothetical protein
MTMLCGASLAAGLAVLAGRRDPSTLRALGERRVAVQLVGLLGAAVLVAMTLTVSGSTGWLYKGGFLLAGIATAGVITSVVAVPSGVMATVLGWAPIRFVGRISYGLYLWHYPLFIWLDHERTGLFGIRLLALRVAVTVAVATASFYLVERPIRHGLVLRGASAVAATVGAVGVTVAIVLSTSLAAALPASGSLPPQPPFHDPVRALMLGDSTMLTLGIAIAPWSHVNDVNENADSTILGCGVTTSDAQVEHGVAIPTNWPCRTYPGTHETMQQIWARAVVGFRPEVVAILAGRWEVHNVLRNGRIANITQPAFQADVAAGLTQAVRIASSHGARVVLMTQPCAASGERADGQPWPEDSPARIATYNRIVRQVAARTGATVLDVFAMVCPGGTYHQQIDGVTVRSPDGVHFAVGPNGAGPYLAPRVYPVLVAQGRLAESGTARR